MQICSFVISFCFLCKLTCIVNALDSNAYWFFWENLFFFLILVSGFAVIFITYYT